jgi:hypothetical protein
MKSCHDAVYFHGVANAPDSKLWFDKSLKYGKYRRK